MDNPQETEKSNMSWLAGFFDAEGSVSFNYKPCIDIVNTCARTSFYIKDILNKIGIEAGINKREKPSKSSKKPRWDIFLRHEEQILPFLKYVKPYVKGKKFQLDLIEDWYNGNKTKDVAKKIQCANQILNKIILVEKKDKVKEKLEIEYLNFYFDIPVLNDEDGFISCINFDDLDYIAGLIDGDGCVNMHYIASKRSKLGRYTPQVLFINTDKQIITSYCSVLKNNNIGYNVQFRTAGKATNRRRWDIVVSGVKRTKNILELITDKLKTKKEQANLLLQYCISRLQEPKTINDYGFECKNALEGMKRGEYV